MGSAEADYEIRARIVAEDASGPGARQAGASVDAVFASTNRLGDAMSRVFAFVSGAAGLGAVASGFVRLNSQLDDAQNGLATLYSALTGADIGTGIRAAQRDVRGLRADAAAGVGELSDYMQAYQMVLGPGLGAGVGSETLRALTRNAIAAAGALGRPLDQAGFDLTQALTSGAHDRTTPIVEAALRAAGKTDAAFNRLPVAKRIEELNAAFARFAPGVALMGQSWTAQFSTLTDNVKTLVGLVGRPLYNRWLGQLRELNGWLDTHRDRLAEIAETWGARLVRLWDTLIARAGTYAAIVVAANVAPRAAGLAGAASGLVGRAGGWLAGTVLPALRDPLGMARAMGVEGATGGVFELLAGARTALSALATPALVATGAILAIKGGLMEFRGPAQYVGEAFTRFGGALDAVGLGLDSLTAKGSVLNEIGAGLVATFGGLVDVAGVALRVFASLAVGLGVVLGVVGDGLRAIYLVGAGRVAEASKISVMDRLNAANKALGDVWTFSAPGAVKKASDDGTDNLAIKGSGNTIINGPVSLTVRAEINADPDRTVAAIGRGLDKIRVAATQARRIPAISGV